MQTSAERTIHVLNANDKFSKLRGKSDYKNLVKGFDPSTTFISKLKEIEPALNIIWIVQGSGPMYIEEVKLDNKGYQYKHLNDKFRELMRIHQLDHSEMGKMLGLARSTISAIARDAQTLTLKSLMILHEIFGIDLNEWIIKDYKKEGKGSAELIKKFQGLEEEVAFLKKQNQLFTKMLEERVK